MSVYVVELRGSERIAVAELAEAGIVAYAPMVTRPKLRRDGRKSHDVRLEPLVPGYAFVWSTAIGREEGIILSCRRVEGLLGGEHPVELRGQWTLWLAAVLMAETFGAFDYAKPADLRRGINVGRMVRIAAGPFIGQLAIVKAIGKTHDNVKVILKDQFFGKLTLRLDHLEAVDAAPVDKAGKSPASKALATDRQLVRGGSTQDGAASRSGQSAVSKAKPWIKLGDAARLLAP